MPDPTPTAPRIHPGYGVPTDGSGGERLPWSWAVERLGSARNYWICTTRGDGRAHAAPVWGLWSRDPALVVHLESGDDVVIIEGEAERVTDRDAGERFADRYEEKYAFRPDPEDPDGLVLVVRPRVALTWREQDYPKTATRWVFGEPS